MRCTPWFLGALIGCATLFPAPGRSQGAYKIDVPILFQLNNQSGRDARISVVNQNRTLAVPARGTAVVQSNPFKSEGDPSTGYYRIRIEAGGQTELEVVVTATYSGRPMGTFNAGTFTCRSGNVDIDKRNANFTAYPTNAPSCAFVFTLYR